MLEPVFHASPLTVADNPVGDSDGGRAVIRMDVRLPEPGLLDPAGGIVAQELHAAGDTYSIR
ncbi:MAG: hypothetical protein ABIR11_08250 [Candidatus Limnocylindrales bacterium]